MRRRILRGFTLIELLVVVAIIAILLAILLPVLATAREKGRQARCLAHQRQIALAIALFAQDHDERLPRTSEVWSALALPAGALHCPDTPRTLTNGYVYNGRADGVALATLALPTRTPLTADGAATGQIAEDETALDPRHKGKLIVGFADGHVALCGADTVDLHFPGDEITSAADLTRLFGMAVKNVGEANLPEGYTGQAPTAAQRDAFLPLLLSELSRYPSHLFSRHIAPKTLVADIVLAQGMDRNGRGFVGCADAQWTQADFSDYRGTIGYGTDGDEGMHKTIHHEVYHIIDRLLTHNQPDDDPEWTALNPPEVIYLGEEGPDDTGPDDLLLGYISQYALRSPYEDKAETFGYLMADPDRMARRCANDAILRAKVALLKRRVASVCPEMDDDYWAWVEKR